MENGRGKMESATSRKFLIGMCPFPLLYKERVRVRLYAD